MTLIEEDLMAQFKELRELEPIFHRANFGTSVEDAARRMADDYSEVGASGRRYSRDFILTKLKDVPPVDAAVAGWTCCDFGLRRLGPETYLLTYTLDQRGRVTRRATIWRKCRDAWQIIFHQGTIVDDGPSG